MLKEQDILVCLKLVASGSAVRPTYAQLATQLHMSASEAHAALHRAEVAQLAVRDLQRSRQRAFATARKELTSTFTGENFRPNRAALLEFLIHGLKYVFPAERGPLTRGMPTSYAAAPLNQIVVPSDEPLPVWPDPTGTVRGYELSPLTRGVPEACREDAKLYELLTLVDAIRDHSARERQLAEKELTRRLKKPEAG